MCGIAGIVDFQEPPDIGSVRRMTRALAHRGPDGEGFWRAEHVVLGHRRLAIVDVENGKQPTTNEDGSVCIVFNGEIYNHRPLRSALESKGHRFFSRCDAEVLPHLYEEYGEQFVERLDGEFSIALWDRRKRALLLVRDRVGVKPLFVHHSRQRLMFASEIKGIFASGHATVAFDQQGLRDCFFYGHPIAPGTFWSGVEDLRPGTLAWFSDSGIVRKRYFWYLKRRDPEAPLLDERAGTAAFRAAFTEAVAKRLPNEVPAGVPLSGGLDSAAVAAVASLCCGSRLPTSTIRMPGESQDEGTHSHYVARELGLDNSSVVITGADVCALLPQALWHVESPQWFGAVATPFYKLAQEGRRAGMRVAITGDGSDELLGGYDFYRLTELTRRTGGLGGGMSAWQRLILRPLLTRHASKWMGMPPGLIEHILATNREIPAIERTYGHVPPWIYLWRAIDACAAPLLGDAAAREPSPLGPPHGSDAFRKSLYFEYVTRLNSWILALSDRFSMAHGIEVRVPFLDVGLLELAAELRPNMFIRHGREKHVLRAAFKDVLPARVAERRKQPFMTPIGDWYLSGPGRELAGDHLSERAVRAYGIFNPVKTEALWEHAVKARGTWSGMLAEWVSLIVMATHITLDQFTSARFAVAASAPLDVAPLGLPSQDAC